MRHPRERLEPGPVARHRHARPYAALVIEGAYEEAGDAGRFRVAPGDVLVHSDFEAHYNVIAARGAVVVNLPLPPATLLPSAFRIADPAALLRVDSRDEAAVTCLLQPVQTIAPLIEDWPDLLAADLRGSAVRHLGEWARRHGLAPETVSRGFRKIYGTTAARFRADARARAAFAALGATTTPLAPLAHDLGFADQAHMARAVRSLTDASPRTWRKVNSVQD